MSLAIDCKFGGSLHIYPPGSDVPIVVTLVEGDRVRVRLAIDAPADVFVCRSDMPAWKAAHKRAARAAKQSAEGGS